MTYKHDAGHAGQTSDVHESRARARARRRERTRSTLLIFLLLLLAAPARAQTISAGEEAARQQLIQSSEAAAKAGDYKSALDGAQRAARLRKSLTLMLFIARMQEQLGSSADAYASGQQCLREGELDTRARLREETLALCRDLVERLKAKVAHIVVNVPQPPEGLSLKLSGQELNQAAIGIPYLITPGHITVEATAPAHVPYRLDVEVPGGGTINVSVTLARRPAECPPGQRADASGRCLRDTCRVGMLPTADGAGCCWPGQSWDAARATCLGTPTCPTGLEVSGTSCVDRAVPAELSPARNAGGAHASAGRFRYGLWVGGAGLAALAGAGVTWLVANGRYNQLEQDCDRGCEITERRRRIEGIKDIDDWALRTAIAGAALVATGAALELFGPSRPRETALAFDPIGRALLLVGRF